ncbi:uncharacterized protein BO97DRAFT_430949 [Aspergillus homomorphus CBS 101889]|uniref:Uncharacterized protein n=1 Tax=Aspergillus homomorphus (strain CBS 101889) TaxID=1450537 RepID=A0A395ICR0_ASPHC|nr:hypothetical protein BO97DRAFT_430949 [Aspergillus homomorphus CBS 101889]RAL16898.1 hypothetical protein BO97DRAFT_430949 [Aspergillus homomorphus CBS 101889]
MTKPQEGPSRHKLREAIRLLNLAIKNFGVDEFAPEHLTRLNIRVVPIGLDEDALHKPCYFAPYHGHLLPELNEETLGDSYNGMDDYEACFTCPRDRAYAMNIVGDYPFRGLDRLDQPEFGCWNITNLDGPAHAHVKAVLYNNMVAQESTLLYGELLPRLRIMLYQLWKKRFAHQMVSPARVIEACFQDQVLVLRSTKLYDFTFTHGNDAAIKMFTRAFIGTRYRYDSPPSRDENITTIMALS